MVGRIIGKFRAGTEREIREHPAIRHVLALRGAKRLPAGMDLQARKKPIR